MGGTGRGKSTVLVCLGAAALEAGKNVLHVTLELDDRVIADRYDARFSGIALSDLSKCPKRLRKRLKAVAAAHHSNLQVRYWPTATLGFGMLRTYLRRLECAAFYPDLILLDYADLMSKAELYAHGGGRGEDRDYSNIGEILPPVARRCWRVWCADLDGQPVQPLGHRQESPGRIRYRRLLPEGDDLRSCCWGSARRATMSIDSRRGLP